MVDRIEERPCISVASGYLTGSSSSSSTCKSTHGNLVEPSSDIYIPAPVRVSEGVISPIKEVQILKKEDVIFLLLCMHRILQSDWSVTIVVLMLETTDTSPSHEK